MEQRSWDLQLATSRARGQGSASFGLVARFAAHVRRARRRSRVKHQLRLQPRRVTMRAGLSFATTPDSGSCVVAGGAHHGDAIVWARPPGNKHSRSQSVSAVAAVGGAVAKLLEIWFSGSGHAATLPFGLCWTGRAVRPVFAARAAAISQRWSVRSHLGLAPCTAWRKCQLARVGCRSPSPAWPRFGRRRRSLRTAEGARYVSSATRAASPRPRVCAGTAGTHHLVWLIKESCAEDH